jgi:membrane-associated phospholipid phosphatase
MGSHHLEYGFPSTHSTNSISIALYLSMIIYSVDLSPVVHVAVAILFGLYAFSIVFGRLYCGMHSFTDCVAGILMGCGIWAVQFCFGEVFENAMMTPGYYGASSRSRLW